MISNEKHKYYTEKQYNTGTPIYINDKKHGRIIKTESSNYEDVWRRAMNMKLQTQRAGGSSHCTFTNNPKHKNDQWFWHCPLFTFIKICHHQKSSKWNQKHYIAVWTFLHNRNDSKRQPWTDGSYRQQKTQTETENLSKFSAIQKLYSRY